MTLENPREVYIKYLAKRKTRKTIEISRRILHYLWRRANRQPDNILYAEGGWTRASWLRSFFVEDTHDTSDSTLFKLLSEMEECGLIERDERIVERTTSRPGKKKPDVYYRIAFRYPDLGHDLLTRDKDLGVYARKNAELAIAKALLRECGIEDPDTVIRERLNAKIHKIKKDIVSELLKTDEEIEKEGAERMKGVHIDPDGEMLLPWDELEKEDT